MIRSSLKSITNYHPRKCSTPKKLCFNDTIQIKQFNPLEKIIEDDDVQIESFISPIKQGHSKSPIQKLRFSPIKTKKVMASVRIKKRHRSNKLGGGGVLRDIINLQKTTHLIIPKLAFMRLVKSIVHKLFPFKTTSSSYYWKASALTALQEVAEEYLVKLFENAAIIAQNDRRVTIQLRDIHVVRRIRHYDDIANL